MLLQLVGLSVVSGLKPLFLQGMEFLHKSSLKSHGNLKPSTCLVDSRLQIKLSGFGLWELKHGSKRRTVALDSPRYEGGFCWDTCARYEGGSAGVD